MRRQETSCLSPSLKAYNDMGFLITIAAALISGLISYGFGRKQQKDQYKLQSSLMTQQAGLNREQYDYEYQKESPVQRMQQYMEAGLNPALMYSNGVAGMQGSVSGVSGSSVGIPNLSNLFDLSETMLDISSSREKEGKTDPAKTEMEWRKSMSALTNSEKVGRDLANKWQEYENKWKAFDTNLKIKYSPEEWDLKIKTMREELDNLTADTIARMNDNTLFGRKREQLDKAIKIQQQTLDNLVAQKDLFVEQANTERSEQVRNYSSANLSDEQAKTQEDVRSELKTRAKLNESHMKQLDALADKYRLDNDYREEVNRIFKKYGVDVSKNGIAGLYERLSFVPVKFLKDVLTRLGVDYNPF